MSSIGWIILTLVLIASALFVFGAALGVLAVPFWAFKMGVFIMCLCIIVGMSGTLPES